MNIKFLTSSALACGIIMSGVFGTMSTAHAFSKTAAKSISGNSCAKAHRRNKRALKDHAKRYCRMNAGSGGRAAIKRSYNKNSCSKNQNGGTTTATGTFTWKCK